MSPIRPPCSSTNFSDWTKHAPGAAAGVIDAALVGLQHLDQQPDDGAGRVKLAAALALGSGETAEEVLIDPPENVAGAVGLLGHADPAHKVDELAEHDLVKRRAGIILGQDALERGIPGLDRQHRVVDVLADRRLLGLGLQMRPASLLRDPEDVLGEVLLRVLRVSQLLVEKLRPLRLKGIRDVFEEDQAERDVLVVGWLHVATQLVRRRPKLRLEPEIGAIVVCLFRHLVLTLVLRRRNRIPGQLFQFLDQHLCDNRSGRVCLQPRARRGRGRSGKP